MIEEKNGKLFMNGKRVFPSDEEIEKLEASLTMGERGLMALLFYPDEVFEKLQLAILSGPEVEMEGDENDT